jgi:serralysin
LAYIEGTSADDRLNGTSGDDVIRGSDGADMLDGAGGDDRLFGGWGGDTLRGGAGADQLDGEDGDDLLLGGDGDDNLGGTLGNDVFDGEGGIDTASLVFGYHSPALAFTFSGNQTYDTAMGTRTLRNVEQLNLHGSRHDDDVTGGAFDDFLFGGLGDDRLSGGDGDDTLRGEEGMDTLLGAGGNDSIDSEEFAGKANDALLDGGAGHDVAWIYRNLSSRAITFSLADPRTDAGGTAVRNVEAIRIWTGDGDDRLTGGRHHDQISGAGGSNILKGLAGNDFLDGSGALYGGAGDDTLSISPGRGIADGGDGIDTLWFISHHSTAMRLSLADPATDQSVGGARVRNIERLYIIGGSLSDDVTGGGYDDQLRGGDGDDFLQGAGGDDQIDGGLGSDTASYASAQSAVAVSLEERGPQDSGGAGTDTLKGIENLTGSSHDDRLSGSNAANRIDGGLGRDVMVGLSGNDTYVVGEAGDRVVEASPAGGLDLVIASASFVLGDHLEKLHLAGEGAIAGTGNALDNIIIGNAAANALSGQGGSDRLDGGAGADLMKGGLGDDVYRVDDALDRPVEAAGAGMDTVEASISHSLRPEVENLVLIGSADIDATGNALSNRLSGNDGANRLDGGEGADLMAGAAGNDQYVVDDAADQVTETSRGGTADSVASSVDYVLGAGVENLSLTGLDGLAGTGNQSANSIAGNRGANRLLGLAGDDALGGGGGEDQVNGGLGRDTLTGGSGADRFVFDSRLGSANADSILDFQTGDDRILLDGSVFGALGEGEVDSAAFHAGRAAQDGDDRIIYDQAAGNLFYDADGTGAGVQLLFARLTPGTELSYSDFAVGA